MRKLLSLRPAAAFGREWKGADFWPCCFVTPSRSLNGFLFHQDFSLIEALGIWAETLNEPSDIAWALPREVKRIKYSLFFPC
jgi:hypothetical protein